LSEAGKEPALPQTNGILFMLAMKTDNIFNYATERSLANLRSSLAGMKSQEETSKRWC